MPSSTPVSTPATELFFPFIASIDAVAAARSPDSSAFFRPIRSSSEQITNDVVAASRTDSVTPTRLSPGVCAYTARIDPGAAGARSPAPKMVNAVSYTHLRAHETDSYLVCRLLLE